MRGAPAAGAGFSRRWPSASRSACSPPSPGADIFDASDVVLMERRPIRSGRQVLRFVTDRKPTYAGIDPYNFYVDRNSADNVLPMK